jgi:hypothetical protein
MSFGTTATCINSIIENHEKSMNYPQAKDMGRIIPKKFSTILEAQRAKHANAYRPWTGEEDEELEKFGIEKSKNIAELAIIFGRNKGAIRSRLRKFGL